MKQVAVWCVLVLLATATFALAQKNAGAEKAITDLEHQWLKGQQTNNAALIEPLLADGFTNTSTEGKVEDRAGAIAEAKATKYSSVDYVDLKVMVFGDTGVAVGTFKAKGTDPTGKPMEWNDRFTDTWAKMAGGKWQCVASHQSTIKK